MKRFPVLLNYDPDKSVGWIEIEDNIENKELFNCAIIPSAIKKPGEETFKVQHFGMVLRSTVDTRLRDHRTGTAV